MMRARRRAAGAGHDLRGRAPGTGCRTSPTVVPVEVKAEFLDRLAAAGLRRAGGHQLRAPEVGAAAGRRRRAAGPAASGADGRRLPGAGAQRARPGPGAGRRRRARRDLRQRHRDVRPAQPEPHARRAVRDVRAGGRAGRCDAGLRVRGYVSMCFGDPWEGAVAAGAGRRGRAAAARAGLLRSSRSATPSAPAPRATSTRCSTPASRPASPVARSPCTSTTPTARRWPTRWPRCAAGSPTVDASAGGLGGCPYAESATGNLATEDLVWMLDGLGIAHGVDLDALVATSAWMAEQLGRPSPSRVVRALRG